MKKATSQDVARLAGVSQATVSLILNNSEKITFSNETKEKVFAAAQQLQYELPRRKKQPDKKSNRTILLLTPTLANQYYCELIQAVEDYADSLDYRVIVCNTFYKPDLEKYYLNALTGSHADGVIYTFVPSFPHLIETIAVNTPVVIIGEKDSDMAICSIELNNINAGAMLAEHLYQLGHRHMAFFSTPFHSLNPAQQQRLDGICRQLEAHGLTDALETIIEEPPAENDLSGVGRPREYYAGRRLITTFLRRTGKATALIGSNDMIALGILNELQEQGYRIPHDYSVCGFDNIFSSSVTTPALTTIDHHLYTRCRSAVDMILSQNEKRISSQPPIVNKIEYTPRLIVRASTSPCTTGNEKSKIAELTVNLRKS